jgi:uncharacterized protein (DUF433 family)
MMEIVLVNHIEIKDGRAVIAGRNLKADMVGAAVVKWGATIEEAMEQYELSRAEVHAALAYYYDNEEAIEQAFREADEYVRRVGVSAEEKIAEMRARLPKKE